MALSIKDPEADRLARELAEVTGQSLTEAITMALKEQLRVVRPDNRTKAQRLADIMKIIDDFRAHKTGDHRSADEIIGYDERGLPS
ncbi:MAG TPA: type II toxin-antitoxin system VapB family antitoxin [Dongiaceae bacterium]|jgi:antitoxin VapB|nr:type II toxin-antitoxin system VapB family antitoxin [Dongiaceae bacterium]